MESFPDIKYKVLRATEWDDHVGVIADQTRCGAKKTRPANQLNPEVYDVTLQFSNPDICNTFRTWFRSTLYHGALSFGFPKLNDSSGTITEYRFQEDSKVHYSNTGGLVMQAQMTWEEV